MNAIKNKLAKAAVSVSSKAKQVMSNNKGLSQTVEIVLIIVLVVAVLGAIFAPQISSWFKTTVMPGLSTNTSNLFNFKG